MSQKELPPKIKAYILNHAELVFSIQSHPTFQTKFHSIIERIYSAQDHNQDQKLIETEEAFFRFIAKAQNFLDLGVKKCDAIRFFI